jgi:phosphoglycerate dehydrogenase-like enzyme
MIPFLVPSISGQTG